MHRRPFVASWLVVLAAVLMQGRFATAADSDSGYQVGVARVEITPGFPVRLSGYGNRTAEATEVEQPLFAKALAIRHGDAAPTVLVTVDTLGVSAAMTDAVASRLKRERSVPGANVAVCASHTHSAPALPSVAGLIFSPKLMPADHLAHMRQYEAELTKKLGDVAVAACEKLEPAQLAYAYGTAKFAINRRALKEGKWSGFGVVPEGVVDHTLPVLVVRDAEGKEVRAVLINYACHCTTLGGSFNKIHGDWAGCAQEQLEREHPGLTAMISIGCGADANPEPRKDDLAIVRGHGDQIAREVGRLLKSDKSWTPIAGPITATREEFALPLAELPTNAEFEQRAATKGPIAYHAQTQLERLAAGKSLPTTVPYSAQTWQFGNALAMVFLPGEVVVDYQLRLKRELDAKRLWVNAYANASPCYIASKRVLAEGGYEVDGSMYYYDQPQHFAPEVEDLIIAKVRGQLPKSFDASVRWEAEIAKIEARDRETPPPTGGIVFTGSSTVRMWKLEEGFSDLQVVNHGFGGSQMVDAVYYFDRLIMPLRPRQVVLYSGSNDLNSGKTPEQVHRDFLAFAKLVREKLPEAKLTFLAIAPNPKRWSQIEKQRAANGLIKQSIAEMKSGKFEYVSLEEHLLTKTGEPQPALHLKDMLHFNAAGYEILNRVLRPHLK
jgi:hypothetical protein